MATPNGSSNGSQGEGLHAFGPRNNNGNRQRDQPQPSVQSTRSASSMARQFAMEEQLHERDVQIARMRRAMRAAGLPVDETEDVEDTFSEEGESNHEPRAPRAPVDNGGGNRRGSTFKTFMDCKPPTFKGGVDAVACSRWLRKMDQTFRSADFTEDQKVNYAVRMLEGEALEWWDTIDSMLTEAARRRLTWNVFHEKIMGRYCSAGAMQRVEREFRDLKKGNMTIAKFNSTFTEKRQFARDCYPTEESLVRHYVECLPYEYRATVRQRATLTEAMDEALKVEDDLLVCNRATGGAGEKRKWDDTSELGKKKERKQGKGESSEKASWCRRCKSSHEGQCSNATISCKKCGKLGHKFEECKSVEPVCFNCWEMGHISTQCPNPKVPREVGMKNGGLPKARGRE